MLNICMERRNIREGGLPFSMREATTSSGTLQQRMEEKKNDSDDEFFDCDDDKMDEEGNSLTVFPLVVYYDGGAWYFTIFIF
jgi:hypothetical protein